VSAEQRRFLVLEQGLGAAAVNFAINALIAWSMFRGASSVPFWGERSIAADTIGTCFFLPFLTGLIVTPLARHRVRSGSLEALGWTRESHRALAWLPGGTARRAAAVGLASAAVAAPLALLALRALGVDELDPPRFVAFKASFAALLAAIVTPILSLWAIAEPAARA
jgi:hypothetical protein